LIDLIRHDPIDSEIDRAHGYADDLIVKGVGHTEPAIFRAFYVEANELELKKIIANQSLLVLHDIIHDQVGLKSLTYDHILGQLNVSAVVEVLTKLMQQGDSIVVDLVHMYRSGKSIGHREFEIHESSYVEFLIQCLLLVILI